MGKENSNSSLQKRVSDEDLAWELSQETESKRPLRNARKSKAQVNYLVDWNSSPEQPTAKKRTSKRNTKKATGDDASDIEDETEREPGEKVQYSDVCFAGI